FRLSRSSYVRLRTSGGTRTPVWETLLYSNHTHTETDRQTDPQQVSGDVALLVPTAGPPPLCLLLVLPAQDGHAVPLPEGQLVLRLHLIVTHAIPTHTTHTCPSTHTHTPPTHTHTHTHTLTHTHTPHTRAHTQTTPSHTQHTHEHVHTLRTPTHTHTHTHTHK